MTRVIDFGYNPPTGERSDERIIPHTFVRDLQHVLDFASRYFSSFWVADHFMTDDRFRLEGWTQLSWMAARYPGQLLGTEVLANSYRHPPLLAKMAATLQFLTGGRFILGYGAGWAGEEYRAYGFEFPSARVRLEQLDEALHIIRAMWSTAPTSYAGQYYQVQAAYCEPRPDPPPPIMIGGEGEQYLLRVVAEHADWWLSHGHKSLADLSHKCDVLRGHCQAIGRDYAQIRKAYPLVVYLAEKPTKAVQWAGDAVDRELIPAFAGDPAGLRAHLREISDLGFDMFLLSFAGFPELDDMRLFAEEVLPAFR